MLINLKEKNFTTISGQDTQEPMQQSLGNIIYTASSKSPVRMAIIAQEIYKNGESEISNEEYAAIKIIIENTGTYNVLCTSQLLTELEAQYTAQK